MNNATGTSLLRLKEVYKFHYTSELQTAALNGVDLEVEAGEFLAVMGPSGSGKSTLLNLLGLIDAPTRGNYYFSGRDTATLSRKQLAELRKTNVSFVFQSFNLIDELTSLENVELPLTYLQVPRRERRRRAEAALAELDMLYRKDHFPNQLSGGQQQRVAIARAIVTEPTLMLADEPTGNLDSENGRIVMEKLREFHTAGTTIVMVTHSETDAAYASRRVDLFDGSILIAEADYLATSSPKNQ